jgi:serralysin
LQFGDKVYAAPELGSNMSKLFSSTEADAKSNAVPGASFSTMAEVVRQGPTDTVPGDVTTTLTISLGGTQSGNVNTLGDRDWYAVTLAAGQSYVFTLDAGGASPLADPYLRLHNSAGVQVAFNDDGGPGLNSRLVFQATADGTYYLSAAAFNDEATGSYILGASANAPLPVFTLDEIADQLTHVYWGGTPRFFVDADNIITYNLTGLTAPAQELARLAFRLWDEVSGLAFQEVAGAAQITLDDTSTGAFASSSVSGTTILSSSVNVGLDWLAAYGTGRDSYTFQTYIHEIGHAIGLGHAGNYNGSATYGIDNHYQNDSWAYSVMSYFDQAESGYGSSRFIMTPQMGDIVAIQNLYGAGAGVRSGDTVYGHNSSGDPVYSFAAYTTAPAFTIYDTGGTDSLDASLYSDAQTISLVAETFSSIGGYTNNIDIARGVVIENANGGSGNDVITGNAANNTLFGNGGADQLSGAAGSDFLFFDSLDTLVDGGADYDYGFVLGAGGVTVNMATQSIEAVQGGSGNDNIDGSGVAAGTNLALNGMGGADQLRGGAGNDTIYFDAGDTVVDGGAGTDFAWAGEETAPVTLNMLAQGIEIAWGGAGNDTLNAAGVAAPVQIDGKSGDDIITGGDANNILIGNGGADQITGGGVGDQLYFDHLDTVVNGGGGFDYAYANNSLGLTVNLATQQLEAVFGGFFDDVLDASGMTSTVYLLGNTGADQLTGGSADDLVFFDHQDTIVDGGAGYNFAYAYNVGFTAVSVNLATQHFDTAWGGFGDDTLDASGKTTSVTLVGLEGADTLTGGTADDSLAAGGGDDLLKGGGGNDTIFGEAGTGDISIYDGIAADYSWTMIGTNVYTVTHTASGVTDTIYNVEFLRFLGGGPDIGL